MYYTVKKKYKINGKNKTLNILHEGTAIPKHGKEFSGIPGKVNEPIEYYENGERLSNDILVKEKLAENHVGIYYNEKGESVFINKINRKPSTNWRTDKPKEWEMFDGTKWIVNKKLEETITKKREKQEKKNKLNTQLNESINFLNSTDYEIIKLAEKIIENSNEDAKIIKQRQQARKDANKIKKQIEDIK